MIHRDDLWPVVFIAALIAGMLAVGFFAVRTSAKERAAWIQYRSAHNCRIVAKQDDDVLSGSGVSSSGKAVFTTTYVPARDGWLCDDGITHWKDAE